MVFAETSMDLVDYPYDLVKLDRLLDKSEDRLEEALEDFGHYFAQIRQKYSSPIIEHCAELYEIGTLLTRHSAGNTELGSFVRQILSQLVICMASIARSGFDEITIPPAKRESVRALKRAVLKALETMPEDRSSDAGPGNDNRQAPLADAK